MLIRKLRQTYQLYERTVPFLKILFTRRGLLSRDGRQLFIGKARRCFLSLSPSFSRWLQKKYGLQGGCTSCGASCNLMFRCPHWDETSHLCTVYEDRPNICRLFPITPGDIRDRNLVRKDVDCGFTFTSESTSLHDSSKK